MATIGTFKKTGSNEFTGDIVTLSVQAKNVRIVPDQRATGENAPSHRVLVGVVAAAVTFAVGQLLITFARPMWLKLCVAVIFVAPAAVAGFHATHGIVKHLMPSDAWQITFSVVGAIAVGITAFVRVAGMATASGPTGRDLARA